MQHIHYFTVYFIHCSVGSTIKALVEISSLLFNAYFLFLIQLFWDQTVIGGPPAAIVDPCWSWRPPALSWIVFCCCHVLFSSRRILLTLGTNRAVHTNLVMRGTERSFVSLGFWLCWIPQFVGCVCVHLLTGLAVQSVSQWSSVRPVQLAKSPGSIACIWPKSPRVSVGSQTWVTHCWHESFTYFFMDSYSCVYKSFEFQWQYCASG